MSNRASAVRMDGTRWMKAYQPLRDEDSVIFDSSHEVEEPNRLANGMVGDLLSYNASDSPSVYTDIERVRRVPKNISFLRGVCWWNDGETPFTDAPTREGFRHLPVDVLNPYDRKTPHEWDACDCDVKVSTTPTGTPPTCAGVSQMHPVPGWFQDPFFYESTNFSAPYFCRVGGGPRGRISEIVRTNVGAMMNANIWNPTSCGINFMSQCVGIAATGSYHCNEYEEGIHRIDPGWDDWNQLALDLRDARIGYDVDNATRGPNLRAVDEATVDFKNEILHRLQSLQNPIPGGAGQTFAHMDFDGAMNGTSVATWQRLYDPLTLEPPTPVELLFPLMHCYLRKTRGSVTIEPYVIKGQTDMDLQMIHVDTTATGFVTQAGHQKIFPHVRFHVSAQIGYKATPGWNPENSPRLRNSFLPSDDPNFVSGYTELELLNYTDADYPDEHPRPNMPPIVRKVGETPDRHKQPDEIVYVDDQGRQFLPPTRIDWWGYMGVYSAIETHNVWNARPDGQVTFTTPVCWVLNELLSGDDRRLKVGGWPYLFQTIRDQNPEALEPGVNGDNAQVYGGFVTLDFARVALPAATGACCNQTTGECDDDMTAATCLEQNTPGSDLFTYLGDDTLCSEMPCGPSIRVYRCSDWVSLEYDATLVVPDVPYINPDWLTSSTVIILRVSAPLGGPDWLPDPPDVEFYAWWGHWLFSHRAFVGRGRSCPGTHDPDIYTQGFQGATFEHFRRDGLTVRPDGWDLDAIQFTVLRKFVLDPDTAWSCPSSEGPFAQVCVDFSYVEGAP